MSRIFISHLQADGARYTSWIVGRADQPIADVRLSGINIRKTRDFYDRMPAHPVPERPDHYPNPFMFGEEHGRDELPACGLYLRHARRIFVRDFCTELAKNDIRPVITQEQCSQVSLHDCFAETIEDRELQHDRPVQKLLS
jgi:hypothetical protein